MINRPSPIYCQGIAASALIKCLLAGFLFFPHTTHSQSVDDTKALREAVEFAIETLPGSQLGLYNGPDYLPTSIVAGGHPYFSTEELAPEKIIYNGIPYLEVYLIFDASRQLVVIEDYAGNKICPAEERIETFTVGVHTFKRISNITGLPAGYYDVLVEGKLFAARSKSVRGLQWKSSNAYYFFNDGRLFPMNKKAILESMADKENDVRQYIRAKKLTFKKKKETSLITLVNYYSSLKQH